MSPVGEMNEQDLSTAAEMGQRLATIDKCRKVGGVPLSLGSWFPI